MATYISGQWKWGGIHNLSQGKTSSYATFWTVPANQMWFLTFSSTDLASFTNDIGSINVNPTADTQFRWNKHRNDTGAQALVQYTGGSITLSLDSKNFRQAAQYNAGYTFEGLEISPPQFTSREILDEGAIWMPGEYLQGRRYANGTGYHCWHYWYMEI